MRSVRTAVVLVSAVAVLAAPQWCCCALGVLPAAAPAEQARPDGGCCCCPAKSAVPACPAGAADHDSCPCRSKPRIAAADFGWSIGDAPPPAPSALDLRAVGSTPWPAVPESDGPPVSLGRRPPARAGRALLRALCVLRC